MIHVIHRITIIMLYYYIFHIHQMKKIQEIIVFIMHSGVAASLAALLNKKCPSMQACIKSRSPFPVETLP